MNVDDELIKIITVKIKIKILAPLLAFCYLVVTGSSMLCASASVYFVNKHAKPYYSTSSSSQSKETVVWVVNRHIVNPSKVSVSANAYIKPIPIILFKEQFVVLTETIYNLYQSENPSVIKDRAPPLV